MTPPSPSSGATIRATAGLRSEDAPQPLKAALWMIGAIVSFSSMAVAGRSLSSELDTFEIMTYRSFIGIAIVVGCGALWGTLGQIRTDRIGTHLVRNVFHFTGQNLWFYALTMIPLAQVFALEFSSPLWVTLCAPLFLKERLTLARLLCALSGFAGILIVARPAVDHFDPGLAAAALAAVGFAGSALFTKLLTHDQSITCILFWLTVMQAAFGLACAGFDGDIAVPSPALVPLVVLVGIAGLLAHMCLTKALTFAPASIVMPFDFLRLPVIAAVGMLLYGEPLDIWVLVGAIVIFGANYLNIWTEARGRRQSVTVS
ncbi:DMT family transporter [Oceaniglobus roseus]|uniref:DMT family transporter n=1 Tax=Oceaniglobus roseus TaxID=1737570 RepID=UPI000C7E9148|nr:DMT family transporter [Kandeliimicrobium roseum]